MRFCSITMEGPEASAAHAIATVKHLVDHSLVVHPGVITDFAKARNDALAHAADCGFDYAMMLDCDERIQCVSANRLRHVLATTDTADVYLAMDIDRFYAKDRIFRLPARGEYVGPTHEAFIYEDITRREVLSGLCFFEMPRTEEQALAKATRDATILEAYTAEHPNDSRWWYYLGDTYEQLGMRDAAMTALEICWKCDGRGEEVPWSAYRIATFLAADNDYEDAIAWCLKGMQRHAAMAELSWLAGWCNYQLGRDHQAVYWSVISANFGEFSSRRYPVTRIGFRTPQALWEWPYDTLRQALARMGDSNGAQDASRLYEAAKQKRQAQ